MASLRRKPCLEKEKCAKDKIGNKRNREGHVLAQLLKAYGKKRDLLRGSRLHVDILRKGLLEKCPYLAGSLISMYANCGALTKAHELLEQFCVRDIVSWNALIGGYAKQRRNSEAIICFDRMQEEGFSPDAITFTCVLKACGSIGDVQTGKKIHDDIVGRNLLEKDPILGTSLMDMYAKCGMLRKARHVFEDLHVRNVVSWNVIMVGCVQHGKFHEALNYFGLMQLEGLSPDAVTFTCIFKACGNLGDSDKGKQIHEQIVNRSLLRKDTILGNALIDMYSRCGMLQNARKILEQLRVRNVVSWNALIGGYIEKGQHHEALDCLKQMQVEGILPDEVTFINVLKACSSVGDIETGKRIHEEVVSKGLVKKNIMLGTALVDMYAKGGLPTKARKILAELSDRNVVSWNALIAGYVQQGQSCEALECFEWMQNEGIIADEATLSCILKACRELGATGKGKKIHDEIVMRGWQEGNIVLSTALVDMYAKCGMAAKADEILRELRIRDNVSWCALISGYAEQGRGHEALSGYERMQHEGHTPDDVTLACALKACGSIGAVDAGIQIHNEIISRGLLESNPMLGTSLVDMYAKCGMIIKAERVLEELPYRNEASWSALIAGYAQQGQGHKALSCFKMMQTEGHSPDAVTFLTLLNACSHTGLLNEAQTYFEYMRDKYGIAPKVEHHTCLMLLFWSSGRFEMAMNMIDGMPFSDRLTGCLALLGACRKWGNTTVGSLTFDHVLQLDTACAPAYVLMADIYAASGMLENADRVMMLKMEHCLPENGHSNQCLDSKRHGFGFHM